MPGEADRAEQAGALEQAIREIRERVRTQYPEGAHSGVTLPDLTAVLQARDRAQGKVAAIGTVNPRRPGPFNDTVQFLKRLVARALDWHVREQVQFNRAAVAGFDALIEALKENNRALAELAAGIAAARTDAAGQVEETRGYLRAATDKLEAACATLEITREELAVTRGQLQATQADLQGTRAEQDLTKTDLGDLRGAWQNKVATVDNELFRIENQLLRTIGELKGAFDFRLGQMSEEVQRRLWGDLALVREQFERLIQTELRVVRQRGAAATSRPAAGPAAPEAALALDYAMLAERFRGPEEHVRECQRSYMPLFEKRKSVLDIGCGRGEFLELMKEAGVPARGIDISPELVEACRAKGLEAEAADAFAFLPALVDESLDGIFCAHLVEHLEPARLPELIRLAAAKLRRGGLIAIETPNPECLAVLASHFYLDPTHQRPVPAALLGFYLEEAGFGRIEVRRLSPAVESMPSLGELPEGFRAAFFDGLDYAITGHRL